VGPYSILAVIISWVLLVYGFVGIQAQIFNPVIEGMGIPRYSPGKVLQRIILLLCAILYKG
jgi:hypothetical protein